MLLVVYFQIFIVPSHHQSEGMRCGLYIGFHWSMGSKFPVKRQLRAGGDPSGVGAGFRGSPGFWRSIDSHL